MDYLDFVYSGKVNVARIYNVCQGFYRAEQGELSLQTYFMNFKKTYEELNAVMPFSTDVKVQQTQREQMAIMSFLAGLGSQFESAKSQILSSTELTTLVEVFSRVLRTDNHKGEVSSTPQVHNALIGHSRGASNSRSYGRGNHRGGGRGSNPGRWNNRNQETSWGHRETGGLSAFTVMSRDILKDRARSYSHDHLLMWVLLLRIEPSLYLLLSMIDSASIKTHSCTHLLLSPLPLSQVIHASFRHSLPLDGYLTPVPQIT